MEKPGVLVCVTRQKTCERLIIEGARVAGEIGAELHVLHVAKSGDNLLGNPSESAALEYLYQTSKEHGADMKMVRAQNIAETISATAKSLNAKVVVMGRVPKRCGMDIVDEVEEKLPGVLMRHVYTDM